MLTACVSYIDLKVSVMFTLNIPQTLCMDKIMGTLTEAQAQESGSNFLLNSRFWSIPVADLFCPVIQKSICEVRD